MKEYISLFFKGIGIGAANVIPGVSGGTIALVTGIFEKLINSIKSFDLVALKLLLTGKFKEFAEHINLSFLVAVFLGVGVSIFSLAKALEFLFNQYEIFVWSYFFGLILASVYFVGKTIEQINWSVITTFIIGAAVAITISFMNPASENDSFFYVFLCGIVAICSMILPGLSGSFVLILMGNYQLVFIDAVNQLDFTVLIPLLLGAGVGIIAFSHFLSWIFKKYKDQTIAILTGFILGSLATLWPWKHKIYKLSELGNELFDRHGDPIIEGYDWYFPETFDSQVIIAFGLIILGIVSIWLLEKMASEKSTSEID